MSNLLYPVDEKDGDLFEAKERVEEYRREVERREEMIAAADHLNAELQAECAAMREALKNVPVRHAADCAAPTMHQECDCGSSIARMIGDAIAHDAGRALLERLEKLEAHRKTADALIQVEMKRAEKAEAALKLSEEFDQDWDEAVARVRAQALEDAAKLVQNQLSATPWEIAAEIRELKGKP